MTEFIAVVSAKGGVGKTTSAINITHALNNLGADTLIVDCDFTSANVGVALGFSPTTKNLHGALNNQYNIREAVCQHSSGLKVVPGSISYEDIHNLQYENIQKFIYDLRGPDYVIVDCPPGLGDEVIKLVMSVDAVLIVTTPDLIAVTDTLKTIKLIRDINKKLYGVIVNRTTEDKHELSVDNIEKFLETKILGAIHEEKKFLASLYYKNPFVFIFPESDISVVYQKIAANIMGKTYKDGAHLDNKRIVF